MHNTRVTLQLQLLYKLYNSVWSSDTVRRHRIWLALVQAMACCLTAPSHYLNQCWLMINEVLWHSPEINFTGNTQDIYPRYASESYSEFKITATSPRANELTLWSLNKIANIVLIFSNTFPKLKTFKSKTNHSLFWQWLGTLRLNQWRPSPLMHACHEDVIKWKHFPRYWPFGEWIHNSPTHNNGCNYLSMRVLWLIHVVKGSQWKSLNSALCRYGCL